MWMSHVMLYKFALAAVPRTSFHTVHAGEEWRRRGYDLIRAVGTSLEIAG